MKVFLRYSPRSSRTNAVLIYNTISKMGHTHISKFVEKADPDKFYAENEEYWSKRYVASLKEMDRADVCFFETSIPSTAMGQLAQLSVEKFKPTILLYTKDGKPYFFRGLAGVEKRVQLLEYNNENLEDVLRYAFEFAEDFLSTRFTLLFPTDIIAYLNKIKKSGSSRSAYIRSLIRKDMKK